MVDIVRCALEKCGNPPAPEAIAQSAKPKRKAYARNIWQAMDKGDFEEFMRHLKKVQAMGTLSTPFCNSVGLTILHGSVGHMERFRMFEALIEAGADPRIENGSGEDVMAYARRVRVFGESEQDHTQRVAKYGACIAARVARMIADSCQAAASKSRAADRL